VIAGTESVPLYNSGSLPVLAKKGITTGAVEEVALVGKDGSVWSDGESECVR